MSPRGGARPGSGPKPRHDETASKSIQVRATEAQLWWAQHLADHAGLTVAEWIRSLIDRAAGEHRCKECDAAAAEKAKRL